MKNSNSIIKLFQDFILKNWFFLHLVFIAFYVFFTVFKVLFSKGINPLSLKPDIQSNFDIIYFGLIITGFSLLVIPVVYRKLKSIWVFVIAFTSYLLISFGYVSTQDKGLKWQGSDVAWGNYSAALEFKEHGIIQGIKMWNERSNPYINNRKDEFSDSVKAIINKFNLNWIAFDKWGNNNIPEGYDANNNRPIMHPPLAPIVISVWLTIFPFGHWSSEILMIFLEFASIMLIFLLSGNGFKNNNNKELILLLALLTTPVMVLFHNPSGEQLSMLLFVISMVMIIDTQKAKTVQYFISGILIGLTFYTKFNIIFYIVFQIIFFFINRHRLKWEYILAYLIGILTIAGIFTILGYYFWLTILTGIVYSKIHALNNHVLVLQGFSKLLYFGITIILFTLLLIFDINKYSNKIVLLPVLLSLALLVIYLWDQGALNRYLTFYLPVLGLLFLNMTNLAKMKTRDILIIPIINFVFISLNTYF